MLYMLEITHISERTTLFPPSNVETFPFLNCKLEKGIFLWILTDQSIEQIWRTLLDIINQISHIIGELPNHTKKIKIIENFIIHLVLIKQCNSSHYNAEPCTCINTYSINYIFKLQTTPCSIKSFYICIIICNKH